MQSNTKIVGFDFGTTNSLISIIEGDRAINFLDEEQRPIPSIVCYEGAQKYVGRAARERLSQSGLGIQGNIIRSPKMYLGRDSIFVEGTERNPIDVVADVVAHVLWKAQHGGRELGEISGAVVTIPIDMEGFRRRALRESFMRAGIRIVQFVHEPLAALYGYFRSRNLAAMLRHYENKLILVFDWGGGTLDLTLCRPTRGMVVQIMNDGTDEVGGDVFDEAIMNSLVKKVAEERGIGDPFEIHTGAKARLMDRCERAKIDLSTRSKVAIYVSSFFRNLREDEFDYSLGQSELEQIVQPLLDKGFQRIERVLANAGFAPEQVALCIATGGMSNMPAVKRRLHEWFGPERVQVPDGTATLIAEGAAWIAADEAGLHLAKNVELILARNSYLPLVKAGTKMPREGEIQSDTFHLYCTDPRDGLAKLQLCAPKRAGDTVLPGDPRTHLENLTVRVDAEARAFRERLEMDVQINDDLIFEAFARSLNKRDQDRREIHNLEFGLKFPTESKSSFSSDAAPSDEFPQDDPTTRGAISVRANIADNKDLSLVPGEFLYKYNQLYFDVRSNPPEEQVNEKLYYQPCSLCGRASNDPACTCSETL
jgi:actin-like ATPase involved in cell morphogenesis